MDSGQLSEGKVAMGWRRAVRHRSERKNGRNTVVFKEWTLEQIRLRLREEKILDIDTGK